MANAIRVTEPIRSRRAICNPLTCISRTDFAALCVQRARFRAAAQGESFRAHAALYYSEIIPALLNRLSIRVEVVRDAVSTLGKQRLAGLGGRPRHHDLLNTDYLDLLWLH